MLGRNVRQITNQCWCFTRVLSWDSCYSHYVNELPDILDESIHKYADDGTLQAVEASDIETFEINLTGTFALVVRLIKTLTNYPSRYNK